MGLREAWLNLYKDREKMRYQAQLEAQNMAYGTPQERLEKAQGLLGSPGWEQSGPLQPGAQREQVGASGLLGSDMGFTDKAKFYLGMLGTGYNPQQAQGLLNQFQQPDKPALQQQFEYYQSLPAQQQEALLDYRRSGAQNINLGGGAGTVLTREQKASMGLPPEGTYVNDKNGIPRQITSAQFTQPQIQAGGFATRMGTASKEITDIYQKYPDFNPAGMIQNLEEMTPVPPALANFFKSEEGQRYRQAQDNWISANLRKESGAAIPEAELENERRKWFPMPGDSLAVREQKARARRDAERSMVKASGGAYQDLEDQADMEELMKLRLEQGR